MKPERQTRQEKIDLQLGRAGSALHSRGVLEAFHIEGTPTLGESSRGYRAKNEYVDYALLDRLGHVLAIVEAKQSSRDALVELLQSQERTQRVLFLADRRAASTRLRRSLPDEIRQRHWIGFGPTGEGAFADTYRARVEALGIDLAA